jgi:hypothetical protein
MKDSPPTAERPVWEAVQPRLEELIAEWEPRTSGKQRITALRLHRQLKAEGYQVGRTLVGDYWHERRRQRVEVYVPPVNRPGEAQIDFFEVVELDGERRKVWEFLLRLMYSGREFAWLYDSAISWSFSTARCGRLPTWAQSPGAACTIIWRRQCARLSVRDANSRAGFWRWSATICSSRTSPASAKGTTRTEWKTAVRRYGSHISFRSHAATSRGDLAAATR